MAGQIAAGGNMLLNSGNNINLAAANLGAGKELTLLANKDINLLTRQDEEKITSYTQKMNLGFQAKISTGVIEAVRDIRRESHLIDDNVKGTRDMDGLFTTASYLVDTTGKTVSVLNPSASAKAGFGGNFSQSSGSSYSSNPSSSLLVSGADMNLVAGRDITIEGAGMKSGGDMYLDAGRNVLIHAARAESAISEDSFKLNAFAGLGLSLGLGGLSSPTPSFTASLGVEGTDKWDTSNTWKNAKLESAGGLGIRSGRDTTVAGGNLQGEVVFLNVGRNLTVASLQDSSSGRNSGFKLGLSIDTPARGATTKTPSAGVKFGSNSEDLIGEQTTIIGRQGVDAYVEANTHMKGAVLAAASGNLKLDTGTLTFENIRAESKSTGFGVGGKYKIVGEAPVRDDIPVSWREKDITDEDDGKQSEKTPQQIEDDKKWAELKGHLNSVINAPLQPTDLSYSRDFTKQTAYATIGAGTIIVRDALDTDLSRLNRDMDNAMNVTTKSTSIQLGSLFGNIDKGTGLFGVGKIYDNWASIINGEVEFEDREKYPNADVGTYDEKLVYDYGKIKNQFFGN